jgi:hypothetical protein
MVRPDTGAQGFSADCETLETKLKSNITNTHTTQNTSQEDPMAGFDYGLLVPLTMFGGMAIVAFKFFDDRHRERMAIIEKGLVKEDLKYLYAQSRTWRINPLSSLKWGMLAAFIGAGILIGNLMHASFPWMHEDSLMSGFIFLLGGIGLIMFYAMAAKKVPTDEQV